MTSHFLFLCASPRIGEGSNSEHLARLAATSLPASAKQTWLNLNEHPLPPFEDLRHGTTAYREPIGHAATLLDAMLSANDIVFVSPLHWYSVPAVLKRLMDEWSAWMRVKIYRDLPLDFKAAMKNTRWRAICVSAGDPVEAEPLFACLRFSANYLGATWKGGLLGHGNKPGDVLMHDASVTQARHFFADETGAGRD